MIPTFGTAMMPKIWSCSLLRMLFVLCARLVRMINRASFWLELTLRPEELMRRCEACLTGKYEIAGEENVRYKLCGGCISQKVYYCG